MLPLLLLAIEAGIASFWSSVAGSLLKNMPGSMVGAVC